MNIIFIALVLSLSCLGWSWDGGWDAGDINGVDIKLDASSFSGNLDSTVTDVQLLANAVDVLVSGGAINWDDPVVVAAIAAQVGWTKGTGKVYTSTATDNVGIGTLLPTSKLSITTAGTNANAMSNTGSDLFVKGNIEFDGKIYGDGSLLTGITGGSGTPGGSSGQIQYNSAGAFGGVDGLIYSGTSLSYASNLGVGTATPSARLHVLGGDYAIRSAGSSGSSAYIGSRDATYGGFWGNVTPSSSNFAIIGSSADTAINAPSGITYFLVGGSEKARFDANGNLGIGVLSPTVKLSVSGSGSVTGTLGIGTANVTNNLVVSGNVGIGSASPVQKLDVIGTIKASSFIGNDGSIQFYIDGGGSAITATTAWIQIPFGFNVTSWEITADTSGSAVVDIDKTTYGSYSWSSIAGSEKPTLSSASKNTDTTLSTWTTAISAGDYIRAEVEATPATVTKVLVVLKGVKQ